VASEPGTVALEMLRRTPITRRGSCRACGVNPRHGATEKRDEIATPHWRSPRRFVRVAGSYHAWHRAGVSQSETEPGIGESPKFFRPCSPKSSDTWGAGCGTFLTIHGQTPRSERPVRVGSFLTQSGRPVPRAQIQRFASFATCRASPKHRLVNTLDLLGARLLGSWHVAVPRSSDKRS